MKTTLYYDYICPFCYLGSKRMETLAKEFDLDIEWIDLFVLIFLMSGPRHFTSQAIAYAASQGVPLASIAVPISGLLAIAGGLSILPGYRAKIGAWLLVLFLVCVTPMMHKFWAVTDPMMYQMQFVI